MRNTISKIKNHWKTGLSYGFGLSRSLAGPITVHIETTNICNFRCIYCPQSDPDKHFNILGRGKMSFEDFKIIIDKIIQTWSLKEIILTRDGEPLVHPQLSQFIRYASDKGLDVTIGSNGSYFTKDRVKELIDSRLTKVKGDFCVDKKYYQSLRVGGKWEQVLQGYRALLQYSISQNKRFQLVLVDLNSHQLTNPHAIKKSLNAMHELFSYPYPYLSIGPALMHNAFDEAAVSLSHSERLTDHRYNRCHHPWIELVIDYKGNAVGCCRDLRSEYILGNVLETNNLKEEIWNGKKMLYLRAKLARKKPESINTCSKCDLPYGVSYAGRGIFSKYFRFLKG
jgi:radical SAM protein with 4Fe4S-binding SPASM domain